MADPTSPDITSVSTETRVFPPPPQFSQRAHIKSMEQYRALAAEADRDPEAYWGARGREELYWQTPFTTVLEWKRPARQVVRRGHHQPQLQLPRPASGHPRRSNGADLRGRAGRPDALTYRQLHAEVCKLANGLRSPGGEEGRPGGDLPAR